MFDSTATFNVTIMSGGQKTASLKFPTDAQWCDRARKQKGVRHILSRGKSRQDAGDFSAADLDLFKQIAVSPADEIDAADASAFIHRLERCEVVDVARNGDEFEITLKVPGGEVKHTLGIPTQRDVAAFGRDSVKVTDARRQQEITVSLEPSAKLWQSVSRSTDGYSGAVPIVHKDVALVELLSQISAIEDEANPET